MIKEVRKTGTEVDQTLNYIVVSLEGLDIIHTVEPLTNGCGNPVCNIPTK